MTLMDRLMAEVQRIDAEKERLNRRLTALEFEKLKVMLDMFTVCRDGM